MIGRVKFYTIKCSSNEGLEHKDLYTQTILKVAFEEGVKCFVTVGQVNRNIFKEIKENGCILIHCELNPTPRAAKMAENAGADIIIATGYDEGGVIPQRSIGTFSIVPTIVDAVERGGQLFRGKPAAAVVNCYRSGTTATLDRLNKYFTFSEMPVVSSEYWNMMFQQGSSIEMDDKGHNMNLKLI